MTLEHPRIYISHAWGGESEDIVREVVRVFDRAGLPVIYDKKDLGYRHSIQQFMVNLGQADIIIIVVSNKYLHSEYCMFELLQIYDNNRELDRIFPIVLEEVQIAKSTQRLELVKYWEQETRQLELKIRELESIANIEGISDDLNLYQTIRNRIARLTAILKDINTLNIQIHRKSDYADLLAAVSRKLDAMAQRPPAHALASPLPSPPPSPVSGKKRRIWPWVLVAVLGILGVVAFRWWYPAPQPSRMDVLTETSPGEEVQDPLLAKASEPNLKVESGNTEPNKKAEVMKSPVIMNPPPATKEDKPVEKPVEGKQTPAHQQSSLVQAADPTRPEQRLEPEQLSASPVASEASTRQVDLRVPRQMIRVELATTLSSNRNRVGDEVRLTTMDDVRVGTYQVIRRGALVRGEVTRAESSLNQVRGELAFRIREVQTEDGQWLELAYPEYSDSRRGEVVFPKGTELANIVLKEANLIWTSDQ